MTRSGGAVDVDVVVVGGGPATLALLTRVMRHGELATLLRRGLVIVDPAGRIGSGQLGQVVVDSDTDAAVFVEVLDGLATSPAAMASVDALRRHAGGPVPMPLAAQALDAVGEHVTRRLSQAPAGGVLRGTVTAVRVFEDCVETVVADPARRRARGLRARAVVLASGGTPALPSGELGAVYRHAVPAHAVLTGRGGAVARGGRTVILGGSHTAFAAAAWLLHTHDPGRRWPPGAIEVHHRSEVRVWYPSVPAATGDGYGGFTTRNVCAATGRVHRMGGLRSAARELYLSVTATGGRPPEDRVRLCPVEDATTFVGDGPVLAALGFRPRLPRVFDSGGAPITLGVRGGSVVDGHGRVLAADGLPVPRLHAIGMAAGWPAATVAGGEPSFTGAVNGLWAYQNLMAPAILVELAAGA